MNTVFPAVAVSYVSGVRLRTFASAEAAAIARRMRDNFIVQTKIWEYCVQMKMLCILEANCLRGSRSFIMVYLVARKIHFRYRMVRRLFR